MGILGKLLSVLCLVFLAACSPMGSSKSDRFFGACNSLSWTATGVSTWSTFQTCMQSSILQGGPTVPSTSLVSFTNSSPAQQWESAVLGPNGKVYGIPGGPDNLTGINPAQVLVYDPSNGSQKLVSVSNPNQIIWYGGVLASNNKIYAIPNAGSNASPFTILVIDTTNDSVSTFNFTFANGNRQWTGAILAPNGKIYAVPSRGGTTEYILQVDPSTNTVTSISFSNPNQSTWTGAVLGPDGAIYGIPSSGKNPENILKFDPNTNSVSMINLTNPNGNSWTGGVIAEDGRIFGIPSNGTRNNGARVFVYDVFAVDSHIFTVTPQQDGNWAGGVVVSNGKIYGIPLNQGMTTEMLVIDPTTETGNSVTVKSSLETWHGAVVAFDGKVYGMPFSGNSTASVLVVDPQATKNFNKNVLLSGYYNKF